MDVAAYEVRVEHALREALAAFATTHQDETFYAVALHSMSRELGAALDLPALAAASDEAGPERESPSSFWSARFTPADWPYPEIDVAERAELERELPDYATHVFAMLERITRRLDEHARSVLRTSDDFVCYWHDEEFGVALARATIAPAVAQRVFEREA